MQVEMRLKNRPLQDFFYFHLFLEASTTVFAMRFSAFDYLFFHWYCISDSYSKFSAKNKKQKLNL